MRIYNEKKAIFHGVGFTSAYSTLFSTILNMCSCVYML
jgi:hypothetical protein